MDDSTSTDRAQTFATGTLTFAASGDVPLDANTTCAAMMDCGAIAITWTIAAAYEEWGFSGSVRR